MDVLDTTLPFELWKDTLLHRIFRRVDFSHGNPESVRLDNLKFADGKTNIFLLKSIINLVWIHLSTSTF